MTQYGQYECYEPGELSAACAKVGADLERWFPGQSAQWFHTAPTEHLKGTISWKLDSATPPITEGTAK